SKGARSTSARPARGRPAAAAVAATVGVAAGTVAVAAVVVATAAVAAVAAVAAATTAKAAAAHAAAAGKRPATATALGRGGLPPGGPSREVWDPLRVPRFVAAQAAVPPAPPDFTPRPEGLRGRRGSRAGPRSESGPCV